MAGRQQRRQGEQPDESPSDARDAVRNSCLSLSPDPDSGADRSTIRAVRAFQISRHGGPEALEWKELPRPGAARRRGSGPGARLRSQPPRSLGAQRCRGAPFSAASDPRQPRWPATWRRSARRSPGSSRARRPSSLRESPAAAARAACRAGTCSAPATASSASIETVATPSTWRCRRATSCRCREDSPTSRRRPRRWSSSPPGRCWSGGLGCKRTKTC